MAQPPQTVKWRQAGSTRSGEAARMAMRSARSFDARGGDRLAGQCVGDEDQSCLAGLGDRRRPARRGGRSRRSRSSVLDPGEQEFAVAVAASDRRGADAERARQPAKASSQARSFSAMRGPSARSFKMPPLPIASRPASNCGLTRRDALRTGCGERQRRRQRQHQRDEADVADEEIRGFAAEVGKREVAGVEPFDDGDARV